MTPRGLDQIPRGLFFGRPSSHWTWEHEREEWQRNASVAPFGEHDVWYEFNRSGYRGEELSSRSEFNILTLGCSCTFGTGLPYRHLFHQVVADRVRRATGRTVSVWNLGIPGASNDLIARLVLHGVDILRPDLTIVSFTYVARREYYATHGLRFDYLPTRTPDWNPQFQDAWRSLQKLTSPADDRSNLLRNVAIARTALRDKAWLLTGAHPQVESTLAQEVPRDQFAGTFHFRGNESPSEMARDLVHPGVQEHARLAEACLGRLAELGVIRCS